MKTNFLTALFILTIFGFTSFAQEIKPDVMPEPIGGFEAIVKNLVYPKSAKDAGVEGQVVVKAIVDEKGNVAKTEVLKSVNADLDKAAVNAIAKIKFTPALKDNKPVEAEIVIPIMFKLS